MSSSFITTAIAHDAVCPKGEEWCFHSFPKPDAHRQMYEDNLCEDSPDIIESQDDEPIGCGCVIAAIGVIAAIAAAIAWIVS